jgi:hypothetical protein
VTRGKLELARKLLVEAPEEIPRPWDLVVVRAFGSWGEPQQVAPLVARALPLSKDSVDKAELLVWRSVAASRRSQWQPALAWPDYFRATLVKFQKIVPDLSTSPS